jgi:hypothetical protein
MEDENKRREVLVGAVPARAERKKRNRNGDDPLWRLVSGIAILAAGLIIWLDHLGRLNASDFLPYWPVVLIAYGVTRLVQQRWTAGGIMIVFGIAFMPHVPLLPHIHLSQILGLSPLLISVAGVNLVIQALHPTAKDTSRTGSFRSIAVMGGSGRTIASEQFLGGDVGAVMGGCDIDLGAARINGEAVIDLLAFWGGAEIKVPRGWQVETNVTVLLGALVNKTEPAIAPNAPRLRIRGSVIMGGVEIKNSRIES